VTNLLSNAAKFSAADQPIELELSVQAGELVVSVRDHGPGIAPEHHEAMFGRFARLPQPEGTGVRGTGLGLYISRRLVEAQGGRIWIESDLGRGATFRFALPAAAAGEGS
jgi:signal transduction histidine kinase